MDKKKYFLTIYSKAQKKFGKSTKRLAGEGWKEEWQYVIATILSAQSRDEVTIPVAEKLFEEYPAVEELSRAKYTSVLAILKSINYNRTKARNVIAAAKALRNGVPHAMDALLEIPGVGRKTANLVLAEVHGKDGICVDTHVHRISNVLGLVKTKTPEQTEYALMKIAPKKYWSRINRLFVLWGKAVPGRDKAKLLKRLSPKGGRFSPFSKR